MTLSPKPETLNPKPQINCPTKPRLYFAKKQSIFAFHALRVAGGGCSRLQGRLGGFRV